MEINTATVISAAKDVISAVRAKRSALNKIRDIYGDEVEEETIDEYALNFFYCSKFYAEAEEEAKQAAEYARSQKKVVTEALGGKSLKHIIYTKDDSYERTRFKGYNEAKKESEKATRNFYEARKNYREARKILMDKLSESDNASLVDSLNKSDSDTDEDVEFDDGFCYACCKGGKYDTSCRCPTPKNPYFDSDDDEARWQREHDREDELRRQGD